MDSMNNEHTIETNSYARGMGMSACIQTMIYTIHCTIYSSAVQYVK